MFVCKVSTSQSHHFDSMASKITKQLVKIGQAARQSAIKISCPTSHDHGFDVFKESASSVPKDSETYLVPISGMNAHVGCIYITPGQGPMPLQAHLHHARMPGCCAGCTGCDGWKPLLTSGCWSHLGFRPRV